jgi:hypothetical protein
MSSFRDELERMYGAGARETRAVHLRLWGTDPFTQGYVTQWWPGDVMRVGPLHGTHDPPFYVCGSDQWPLLRVPEDVPRHRHRGDVVGDLVVAPADPVRPDDVRHGVAAAPVVERVLQLGPDVLLEVRQVRVVERLE